MKIEKLMRGEPGVRECRTPYPKEKAYVEVEDDGTETLVSYNNKIMRKHTDGTYFRLCEWITRTTLRHVISFSGKHKKEFDLLEYETP